MTQNPPSPIVRVPCTAWRNGSAAPSVRSIPEETAIAFTYNRHTHAVMMATPADLEDFAVGFSLYEGIIASPDEIRGLDVIAGANGVELRITLPDDRNEAFISRRRYLAGVTGCGLCGMESLEQAMKPPAPVTGDLRLPPQSIARAISALPGTQALNRETRAVHAAAFWEPGRGVVAVREDVGRHNALDKLAGALARAAMPVSRGVVLLTSRVSIEMVQKAATMGAQIVVAVSAPTALAVRMADAAGITLVAIARDDGFEIFTHPRRVATGEAEHVA
ncbi:MAG: formate dehydrogenase accessory sulfurtransferase FdhD [Gemmatimonas sp.]